MFCLISSLCLLYFCAHFFLYVFSNYLIDQHNECNKQWHFMDKAVLRFNVIRLLFWRILGEKYAVTLFFSCQTSKWAENCWSHTQNKPEHCIKAKLFFWSLYWKNIVSKVSLILYARWVNINLLGYRFIFNVLLNWLYTLSWKFLLAHLGENGQNLQIITYLLNK